MIDYQQTWFQVVRDLDCKEWENQSSEMEGGLGDWRSDMEKLIIIYSNNKLNIYNLHLFGRAELSQGLLYKHLRH